METPARQIFTLDTNLQRLKAVSASWLSSLYQFCIFLSSLFEKNILFAFFDLFAAKYKETHDFEIFWKLVKTMKTIHTLIGSWSDFFQGFLDLFFYVGQVFFNGWSVFLRLFRFVFFKAGQIFLTAGQIFFLKAGKIF